MFFDKVPLQQSKNQMMLITPTQSGSPNQFVTNTGYEETQIQTLARSVFNGDPTPSYKEVLEIGSPSLELSNVGNVDSFVNFSQAEVIGRQVLKPSYKEALKKTPLPVYNSDEAAKLNVDRANMTIRKKSTKKVKKGVIGVVYGGLAPIINSSPVLPRDSPSNSPRVLRDLEPNLGSPV
jgi:hypothetical protein